MADPINLRQFRKQKQREEREDQAEQNRVTHGMSKAQRQELKAHKNKQTGHLDGHKLDDKQ